MQLIRVELLKSVSTLSLTNPYPIPRTFIFYIPYENNLLQYDIVLIQNMIIIKKHSIKSKLNVSISSIVSMLKGQKGILKNMNQPDF